MLDFVGNSRPEYNFDGKFRALVGKSPSPIQKEIEDNFPHLPLGCSIVLEKKAKEYILDNVRRALSFNKRSLINKIKLFKHHSNLSLSLSNFLAFNNTPIQTIYKGGGWMRLCAMVGVCPEFNTVNEASIISGIKNKWLSTQSTSYFQFIRGLAKRDFDISIDGATPMEEKMLLMLHYDVWGKDHAFDSLQSSIREIGRSPVLVEEILEVMDYLLDRIDFKEVDYPLFGQPLKLHSRYTRDHILCAFGFHKFHKSASNREGVAFSPSLNVELLFINLIKSEEDFSPTTMYEDYAISQHLFHWQSQNAVGPESVKGKSYINHRLIGKRILLFVRETSKDEYGGTLGYVFVGEGVIKEWYGSKPMSIVWELKEPLPHYLWKDAAKLQVG